MRALVAPTAFKGTLDPVRVARAMVDGLRRVWPDARIRSVPLSDGGDGLIEASRGLYGGTVERIDVIGPLGDPVRASYLRSDELAVIESAEACGLRLVPVDRRDPLRTTSRGVGELIRAAAAGSPRRILLGLGGSATVDGGTGMARALGWRFLGRDGAELGEGGGDLKRLERIEAPEKERQLEVEVVALCDVLNPLLGSEGGVRVYSPQKGAEPGDVKELESALERLVSILERDGGVRVRDLPGAGAAGGLGAGCAAFLSADLRSGADWMIEASGIEAGIANFDLVLTGEGRYDAQSSMGKITGRILDLCRSANKRAVLVCGSIAGRLPPGVSGAAGRGGELDAEAVSDLTESACRAVPRGDTL